MRRHIGILLISLALLLGGIGGGVAMPKGGLDMSAHDAGALTFVDDRGPGQRRPRGGNNGNGRDKDRGKIGNGFWGGVYWGFGTRLGHRCETCKSNCRDDGSSRECERCRVRCGW